MVSLNDLVRTLDAEFSFYCGLDDSCNGLQVEGIATVKKVAVACDAALETIQKAASAKADLLLVHHGLFWKNALPQRICGYWKNRLKSLLDADMSLYAMHLPLDAHPTLGNNAVLAKRLGLKNIQPCGEYKGAKIAMAGDLPKALSLSALAEQVKLAVGEARVFPFHNQLVSRIAVCSGGGAFIASEAAKVGFDTLVTGEVKHVNFHDALEAGCSLIEAGHYNTEVLGVQALGEYLHNTFGVPFVFIEAPTGL